MAISANLPNRVLGAAPTGALAEAVMSPADTGGEGPARGRGDLVILFGASACRPLQGGAQTLLIVTAFPPAPLLAVGPRPRPLPTLASGEATTRRALLARALVPPLLYSVLPAAVARCAALSADQNSAPPAGADTGRGGAARPPVRLAWARLGGEPFSPAEQALAAACGACDGANPPAAALIERVLAGLDSSGTDVVCVALMASFAPYLRVCTVQVASDAEREMLEEDEE
eukprot:scaffold24670_cov79-Isochrysis_galbana.AAC.1